MSFFKRMSQLEKLLPPGKYAELAAKEAAQAWKPGELSRLVVPPRVSTVSPKFALDHLEQWQRIAKSEPSPENLRRLKEAELDLLGVLESRPYSSEEQAAEDRLNKILGPKEKQPEVLTKEQMREKRKLDEAAEETQKIEEDSDKTPLLNSNLAKKTALIAALTGGGFAASSLTPEEAEAGAPRLLPRKAIAKAMKVAERDGSVDINKLFQNLGAVGTSDDHLIRGSNILDHLIFEKTGLPENKAMEAVQTFHPELKKLRSVGPTKDKNLYGEIIIPESEIGGVLRRDPLNARLRINEELKTRAGEAALLAHEAQHLRDAINAPSVRNLAYPQSLREEIENIQEIINASPEKKQAAREAVQAFFKRDPFKNQQYLSFDDVNDLYLIGKKTGKNVFHNLLEPINFPEVMTFGHHIEYPKNYEWEKSKELIEQGVRSTDEDALFKKMQDVSSDYRQAAKKTAAIGGAAIGAGMLANSSSAHADEGPTVSQSNPEFSSSSAPKPFVLPSFAEKALKTQAFLGKMEEEGKLAPDVTSYLYDTAYKYGIDPAKRKVMGLLTGKDVPEEETPSYSDIYKQGFENIGKENVGKFLKGFASAAAEDPTGTTQDLIQSAKDEDVADYVANTAAGVSELAEDPLAPFMAGVGKLPKTMRTISKFRPK